jgi:putative transposase
VSSVGCFVIRGYYAWRKREPSRRQRENEQLTEHIRQAYQQGRHVYGSPRVHAPAAGIRKGSCVGSAVWRAVWRQADLRAIQKRRRICTTDSHHSDPVAPNVLQRDFTAPARCRKGLTDSTAVWTVEGWLYLAVVLDVYSRLVVGWAMASHRDEGLVEEALWMALGWRKPVAELMHHSDRRSQYTSMAYQAVLAQFQIQVSMSGKGD